MRRFAVAGAIAAILLVPTGALAASQTYDGLANADPATAITIKVKRDGKKRYLTRARAENLFIECSGGDYRLAEAELAGRVKVKRGRFRAKATDGVRTVVVTGKIVKRTIKGTFRYSGLTPIDDEDPSTPTTQGCDSGRVPFTATR